MALSLSAALVSSSQRSAHALSLLLLILLLYDDNHDCGGDSVEQVWIYPIRQCRRLQKGT